MDRNLGDTVAWCTSSDDNSCEADGALAELEIQTGSWKVEVSLPTYEQIYNVNLTSTLWLWRNLDSDKNTPLPSGYWTSTPYGDDSTQAYFVNFRGELSKNIVSLKGYRGVRPVIIISKKELQNIVI